MLENPEGYGSQALKMTQFVLKLNDE